VVLTPNRGTAARGRARLHVLGLAILALPGCILLVDAEHYGSHCRFAGSDSECGACIAEQCPSEIDACCTDVACAGTLTAVEGCTTRRDQSCDDAKAAARLSSSPASSLGKCVAERCAGECERASPTPVTTCGGLSTSNGTACTCKVSSSVNSFVCNTTTFPETICCAPAGWPAPGLECTCLPVRCSTSTDGCSCGRVDFGVADHSKVCEGAASGVHCCAAEDFCHCGAKRCESSEHEVPSCSIAAIGCVRGQERQTTCTK
jgi:hypothetical protein